MKKLASAIITLTSISFVGVANAQGITLTKLFVNPFVGTLETFITGLITWIIGVSGLIAFFFLIYGGFQYLTAGGDSDKVGKGRTTITNAVIGLVIVAIAFAIATFVIRTIGSDKAGTGSVSGTI